MAVNDVIDNPLLEAALQWTRSGFSVLPVGRDKRPRVAWRGLQTTPWTEEQVTAWWTASPKDNVAVIPGSGDMAVIDADIYKDGGEGLADLFMQHGLEYTYMVIARTGSGGRHYWFHAPGGLPSRPLSDTIDVKSNGGYVLVPPSVNDVGEYSWEQGGEWVAKHEYGMSYVPTMPDSLLEVARGENTGSFQDRASPKNTGSNQDGGGELVSLARAMDGREKVMADAVWWAGHRMLAEGLSLDDHEQWQEIAWERFCDTAKGRGGVPLESDHSRADVLYKVRHANLDALHASYTTDLAEKGRQAPYNGGSGDADGVGGGYLPDQDDGGLNIKIEKWTTIDSVDGSAHDFVEGLLTEESISLWFGPSNTGKTFMVFSLAAHVAMGKTWFGREVDQGRAVYCAFEGLAGIQLRRWAVKKYMGAEAADIPLDVVTANLSFLDPARGIAAFIKAIGPAKLVIIDTLAAVTAGGDENSGQVMTAVVACAEKIKKGCGAHVLIVHHQGKGKGNDTARGHSSLKGGIDTEVRITSTKAGLGKCEITKQRDLPAAPDFGFVLETVELGVNRRGRTVTSCVAKETSMKGDEVELSRDEHVLKTIVDNIISGRDPRPIVMNHSGGAVRCRDHVSRAELMDHFKRHAINATRAEKSVKNAFSKAWVGLSRKFGTGSGTQNGTLGGQVKLSLDNNNLGIV